LLLWVCDGPLSATHVAYNVCCFYDTRVIPTQETPLARLLNGRGVRHSWLAQQLGVSKFAMHRVLTGKQSAPAEWYERAAEVLGVPVEDIMPEPEATAA
jgi:hypothetical protein